MAEVETAAAVTAAADGEMPVEPPPAASEALAATPEPEKDPHLESAMAKLTHVSMLYDHARDFLLMRAFEGRAMTKKIFRQQLGRAFNLRLSDKEMSALVKMFDLDGDNTVDGAEFLLVFFRLGFDERSRRHTAHRAKLARREKKRREEERKSAEDELAHAFAAADFDNCTEEHLKSAVDKITLVSKHYDKQTPGAPSLAGFGGKSMTPLEFKKQLKRTFRLDFSRKEMGALIKHFDKDGDRTIDCPEFLIEFFRLGFLARETERRGWADKEKRNQERARVEEERKAEELAKRNADKVTFDFTEAERKSAVDKITLAATLYDRKHPAAVQLDAFDGAEMEPHVFKEQLKRVFNIKLTPGELGAMICHFDENRDGTINCAEFLKIFFKTGFAEKEKIRKAQRAKQQKLIDAAEAKKRAHQAELERMAELSVTNEFSQEDTDRAIGAIRDAAAHYDRNAPGCVQLDAFDGAQLEPHVFKEQLKRVFNIKLNPRELGAAVAYFDSDGSGDIDCAEFLIAFFKLGFEERSRRKKAFLTREEAKKKQDAERRAAVEAEKDRKAREFTKKFSEEDKRSAMAKIEHAAFIYDATSPAAVSLAGFQGADMTAAVFREQLKRVFNLNLTKGELGAIIDHFDDDNSGTITGVEFVANFMRLGFEKRTERIREIRQLEAKANEKRAEEWRRRLTEIEENAKVAVDFNYKPADLEFVLDMLIDAAVKYDVRFAGPTGLKGFSGASMTPTVFKRQLWSVLSLKVNPPQLGAFIKIFDLDGDGMVDTPEFLTQFYKVGLEAKGYMGKPDYHANLEKLKDKLKARMTRHPTQARAPGVYRPPRTASPTRRRHFGHAPIYVRPARPPATSQDEVRDRRLACAKVTHKLDFSTAASTRSTAGQEGSEEQVRDLRCFTFPESVLPMTFLTELWLSNHIIEILPAHISRLSNLRVLAVDGNRLADVAPAVGQLTQLRRLLLHKNRLVSLPPTLASLSALEELTLDHNCLEVVPEVTGHLGQLRRLTLNDNKLSALPATVFHGLKRLVELDVTGNPDLGATTWSNTMSSLLKLPVLALTRTQGTRLPADMRFDPTATTPPVPLHGLEASVLFPQVDELNHELKGMLRNRSKAHSALAAKKTLQTPAPALSPALRTVTKEVAAEEDGRAS